MKNCRGITLVALIITIIVLLILAGISLGALTGNNSILKMAKGSKEDTEIAEEKELIELSAVNAMGKNRFGNLEENNLQDSLDKNFGEGETTAFKGDKNFLVVVEKSGRVHTLNDDGDIEKSEKIEVDETAGDITKNGEAKGTAALPYKITCIEDLVAFSKAIGNNEISRSCYAIVTRDLDFRSILSYANYKKTYSYNSEKNAYVEDENSSTRLMELCTTEQGFIPINHFCGNFNGQEKKISNMYINTNGDAGLFGIRDSNNSTVISNITVTGEITSTNGSASGILGKNANHNYRISNCHNEAIIDGYSNAGGIIGDGGGFGVTIIDCSNTASIKAGSQLAGIIGIGAGTIKNCYNTGNITVEAGYSTTNVAIGGIIGKSQNAITLTNCYNTGAIKGIRSYINAGGIIGLSYGRVTANNSFNVGEVYKRGTWRSAKRIWRTCRK